MPALALIATAIGFSTETAATIGAVGTVAATVASVGEGIYSATKKVPGAPDITLPQKQEAVADTAAQAQAEALRKRRGMASTIMTSPMGGTQPTTQRQTLGT
jgi:hypothetical protein